MQEAKRLFDVAESDEMLQTRFRNEGITAIINSVRIKKHVFNCFKDHWERRVGIKRSWFKRKVYLLNAREKRGLKI